MLSVALFTGITVFYSVEGISGDTDIAGFDTSEFSAASSGTRRNEILAQFKKKLKELKDYEISLRAQVLACEELKEFSEELKKQWDICKEERIAERDSSYFKNLRKENKSLTDEDVESFKIKIFENINKNHYIRTQIEEAEVEEYEMKINEGKREIAALEPKIAALKQKIAALERKIAK